MAERGLNNYNGIGEDRLSKLPISIIHHILSFLPTSVVIQTSLLSTHWMHIWASLPTFEFIYDYEDSNLTKFGYFLQFMNSCMLQRLRYKLITDVVITKLKLQLPCVCKQDSIYDKWIRLCIRCNVKELDIHLTPEPFTHIFPLSLIHASTTLTTLKLKDVSFYPLHNNSLILQSLKTLSLSYVDICDRTLQNLILGCPLIETLHLHNCHCLFDPKISSASLLFFAFKPKTRSFYNIGLQASNLKSFTYQGSEQSNTHYVNMNPFSCGSITKLTFSDISFSEDWLRELSKKLLFLESLSLERCTGFPCITICIQFSERFTLKLCVGENHVNDLEANFCIPNVSSFAYEGNTLFSKVSVRALNLKETKVKFSNLIAGECCTTEWYVQLVDFLMNFDSCKMLTLDASPTKLIKIPKRMRRICRTPLPTLKHLVIKKRSSSLRNSKLKSVAQWLAPCVENLQIEEIVKT